MMANIHFTASGLMSGLCGPEVRLLLRIMLAPRILPTAMITHAGDKMRRVCFFRSEFNTVMCLREQTNRKGCGDFASADGQFAQ
jgi:hypothetical protein